MIIISLNGFITLINKIGLQFNKVVLCKNSKRVMYKVIVTLLLLEV